MDVGWELPLFSFDLEPRELKRLRCSVCATAWANIQCHRCSQQFCHDCEAMAHSAASDPSAHQEMSEECNSCQDCMKASDIFCRDCDRYQCAVCCASTHLVDDAVRGHVRICMEGAPVVLLQQDVWDGKFKDYAKMTRRRQQHAMTQPPEIVKQEAGALCAFLPLSPTNDDDDEATSEEGDLPSDLGGTMHDHVEDATRQAEAVQIKMERVHLHERLDVEDLVPPVEERGEDTSSTVDTQTAVQVKTERIEVLHAPEQPAEEDVPRPPSPPPLVPSPPVQVKTERIVTQHIPKRPAGKREVVDLTGDDDDDENDDSKARGGGPTTDTNPLYVKAEPLVVSEWSVSTTTTSSAVPSVTSSFADDDPIRSALIHEYNSLNQQVLDAEQQRMELSQRAASSGSMQDMRACQQQLAVLRNTLIKLTHSRTAAVARLLFYLYGGDAVPMESDVAVDIPHAQAALHGRLRGIQAVIEQELQAQDVAKRQVVEAVNMKSGDAMAEVLRLGAEISTREAQLETLETQRLDGFRQLARVSAAVRSAALALVVENKPKAEAANAPRAL